MAIDFICHHDIWHVVQSSEKPEMSDIYEDVLEEFR